MELPRRDHDCAVRRRFIGPGAQRERVVGVELLKMERPARSGPGLGSARGDSPGVGNGCDYLGAGDGVARRVDDHPVELGGVA